jgi:hypothetical protein
MVQSTIPIDNDMCGCPCPVGWTDILFEAIQANIYVFKIVIKLKLSNGFTANQQPSEFDFRFRSISGDKGSLWLCAPTSNNDLVKSRNVHTPDMTNPRSLATVDKRS